jgi:hypothetical protein
MKKYTKKILSLSFGCFLLTVNHATASGLPLDPFGGAPAARNPRHLWDTEEDEQLRAAVAQHGTKNWRTIASFMPNRTPRQCLDRYWNYLATDASNSPWTEEEDALLLEKYAQFGPKWMIIARFFNNRSRMHIKNRYELLQRRLEESARRADPQPDPGRQQLPPITTFPFPFAP